MTTRKKFPARPGATLVRAAILSAVALGGGGCATPGPLHLYTLGAGSAGVFSVASTSLDAVQDTGPDGTANVPSFVGPNETLTGFAYDPFTDHFFLRLAPGNRIRVVDRPARAIKREFKVDALSTVGGGDLAIRPRDGHVFALEPTERAVVEFTRLGEFVRRLALDALPGPAAGLAYDSARDRLLVLSGGKVAHVTAHALDGSLLSSVALDGKITPAALAYDPEKKEFYVPLNSGGAIGVFGEDGRPRGVIPVPATFLDVGSRSFIRMF